MEIVECIPYGREKLYTLKDKNMFILFLLAYEKHFLDSNKIRKILIKANNPPKVYLDKFADYIFEVFPHPYHV